MIDETARIAAGAQLADDVEIGPFSIIGPDVEIGPGTRIGPHVVITGHTRIGANNRVFQFTSIGEEPQHKSYKGEPTRVEIGDNNVIRENVTIHRGTELDEGVTRIGNDNWIMAYVHIAHDCRVGSQITMANGASMAGHAWIGDHCILGGFALIYQFCRIGELAYVGYGSGVSHDVPPFIMCSGYPAQPHGINSEGLRRHGYDKRRIAAIKQAYKLLYRSNLRLVEAREQIAELSRGDDELAYLAEFLADSKRSIIR